jgi:trehalose utilization protein
MTIRVTIWNENAHEKKNALVKKLYPDGIHSAIAAAFKGETPRRRISPNMG